MVGGGHFFYFLSFFCSGSRSHPREWSPRLFCGSWPLLEPQNPSPYTNFKQICEMQSPSSEWVVAHTLLLKMGVHGTTISYPWSKASTRRGIDWWPRFVEYGLRGAVESLSVPVEREVEKRKKTVIVKEKKKRLPRGLVEPFSCRKNSPTLFPRGMSPLKWMGCKKEIKTTKKRTGFCLFMCWFMPAHKSDAWCVWLHRIYGDGRVEQLLIWLAGPIFDMFELSPIWRSVQVLLLLLSLLFCSLRVCMFRVASGTPVL